MSGLHAGGCLGCLRANVPELRPVAHTRGAEWFLVLGDAVSVQAAGSGAWVAYPPKLFLLHDRSGAVASPCDVFVGLAEMSSPKDRELSDTLLQEGERWYGRGVRPQFARLAIPLRRWSRQGDVTRIRYQRFGVLANYYEHPYAVPVQRFSHTRSLGRIALPEGCVLDEHGFVKP